MSKLIVLLKKNKIITASALLFVFLLCFFSIRIVSNKEYNHDKKSQKSSQKDNQREKDLNRLLTLPYLQGYSQSPKNYGVTIHDKSLAFQGLNLYIAGHSPSAYLMDMQGEIHHEWHYKFADIWSKEPILPENKNHDKFWRRVRLFENGDLLAIYSGLGMIKVDKDSRLLWSHKGGEHHDFFVDDKGCIYALTRERTLLPEINEEMPVLLDYITILDSLGREIRKISLFDCLKDSQYVFLLEKKIKKDKANAGIFFERIWEKIGKTFSISSPLNIFHTNTLEIIQNGNALVSFRNLHIIAIIDLNLERVVWASWDKWKFQHQPTLLNNGNILLFDNFKSLFNSAVVELDLKTEEIIWEYSGTTDSPFFSATQGSNQPLPNGNILITESNRGRAFEVTPSKKIVWEFIHPNRVGNSNELIANLCELIRLTPNFTLDWLNHEIK